MIRLTTFASLAVISFAAYTCADLGVWWAAAVCVAVGLLVAGAGVAQMSTPIPDPLPFDLNQHMTRERMARLLQEAAQK